MNLTPTSSSNTLNKHQKSFGSEREASLQVLKTTNRHHISKSSIVNNEVDEQMALPNSSQDDKKMQINLQNGNKSIAILYTTHYHGQVADHQSVCADCGIEDSSCNQKELREIS
ncbi:hypothetical protein AMTR_s00061p00155970 [Amborella trichopoda]|uniref:Uncharacterized protein n=1 Tax=Amborella trichopoda TaxID=13333 RepID=U5DFE4_AMBTC|nr:hypothetical protein AMTR_s00061p00155970 [Amborella trichopoda]